MVGKPSATLENDIGSHRLVVQGQLFELYDQMLGEVDVVRVLQHTTQVVRQVLEAERATTYLVRPELFEDRTRPCAPGVDDLRRGEIPLAGHGGGARVNIPVRLRNPESLAEHVLEAWRRAVGGPAK